MKKIAFIFIFLFAAKVHSLLPPFYQSVKEIKSILSDEEFLSEASSAYPIIDIKKVEGGYLIITSGYEQFVEINYIPQEMIGPAKFEFKFHEKEHINSCR
ncbi:MAG: hypothetical protein K1060chlam1_00527 [Candidatus Anoxychlamydiales bacterium]|nr:hypothetical protein [Candidatus Anoxychlamydiales bacterium]